MKLLTFWIPFHCYQLLLFLLAFSCSMMRDFYICRILLTHHFFTKIHVIKYISCPKFAAPCNLYVTMFKCTIKIEIGYRRIYCNNWKRCNEYLAHINAPKSVPRQSYVTLPSDTSNINVFQCAMDENTTCLKGVSI